MNCNKDGCDFVLDLDGRVACSVCGATDIDEPSVGAADIDEPNIYETQLNFE